MDVEHAREQRGDAFEDFIDREVLRDGVGVDAARFALRGGDEVRAVPPADGVVVGIILTAAVGIRTGATTTAAAAAAESTITPLPPERPPHELQLATRDVVDAVRDGPEALKGVRWRS